MESAEMRLMKAMSEMWDECGNAIYPVTAHVTRQFKEEIDSCYSNTVQASSRFDVEKIESDFGTVILAVVDEPIPGGFSLTSVH